MDKSRTPNILQTKRWKKLRLLNFGLSWLCFSQQPTGWLPYYSLVLHFLKHSITMFQLHEERPTASGNFAQTDENTFPLVVCMFANARCPPKTMTFSFLYKRMADNVQVQDSGYNNHNNKKLHKPTEYTGEKKIIN